MKDLAIIYFLLGYIFNLCLFIQGHGGQICPRVPARWFLSL